MQAFRITWRDADGDEITIASDDDIIIAQTSLNGTADAPLRLRIVVPPVFALKEPMVAAAAKPISGVASMATSSIPSLPSNCCTPSPCSRVSGCSSAGSSCRPSGCGAPAQAEGRPCWQRCKKFGGGHRGHDFGHGHGHGGRPFARFMSHLHQHANAHETATTKADDSESFFDSPRRSMQLSTPFLQGDDVVWLQGALNQLGFHLGPIDGVLGPRSMRALTEFQHSTGLQPDGVCGRKTFHMLQKLLKISDVPAVLVQHTAHAHPLEPIRVRRFGLGYTCDVCQASNAPGRHRCTEGCDWDACGACMDRQTNPQTSASNGPTPKKDVAPTADAEDLLRKESTRCTASTAASRADASNPWANELQYLAELGVEYDPTVLIQLLEACDGALPAVIASLYM